jgi:hypothetical protein
MKKTIILIMTFTLILCVILTACSSSSNQSSSTEDSSTSSLGETSLSQVNLLLVGTLKLENTDQAVTAAQASSLLPLWQAYRILSTSQTAAEAEVDGLIKQIESTMTTDQTQAIKALNLTNTDMMELMQTIGGMLPQGTSNPQSTPSFDNSLGVPLEGFPVGGMDNAPSSSTGGGSGVPSRSRPSGGGAMSGGGPLIVQGGPGMGGDAGSVAGLGGGPMLQGTPNPTIQARFNTQASQVNGMLLNVLINKLEAMAKN